VRILLFILLTFLASCETRLSDRDVPDDLISRPRMEELLTEISILEAAIGKKYGTVNKSHKVVVASVDNYLKKEGYTSEQFRRSLDYYHGLQIVEGSLYSPVIDSLAIRLELTKKSDN